MTEANQEFYLQNPWPKPEDLIDYAEKQLHIEKNEEDEHRYSLCYLLKTFRDFVREDSDQENPSFWILNPSFWILDEPKDGQFPLEELKMTLNNFFESKIPWRCPSIDNSYKHEHFAVLFFIAALRYVKFPPPVRQRKFDQKKGKNPRIDLFFFNKNQDETAAFAVQVVILAKKDIFENMTFNGNSLRAQRYQEKGLSTFDELRQYSIDVAYSFAYGYRKSFQPTTKYLVVHICPYEQTWDECGLYDETITPEFESVEDLSLGIVSKDDQIAEEYQESNDDDHCLNQSQNSPPKAGKNLLLKKKSLKNKNERIKGKYNPIPQSPLSKPFKAPCNSLASTQKDMSQVQSSSSSQSSFRKDFQNKLCLGGKDSVTLKVEGESDEKSFGSIRRRNGFRSSPFKLEE